MTHFVIITKFLSAYYVLFTILKTVPPWSYIIFYRFCKVGLTIPTLWVRQLKYGEGKEIRKACNSQKLDVNANQSESVPWPLNHHVTRPLKVKSKLPRMVFKVPEKYLQNVFPKLLINYPDGSHSSEASSIKHPTNIFRKFSITVSIWKLCFLLPVWAS